MVSLSDFSEWMKENTELSDSSIYKYTRAVNTISNEMQELKELCRANGMTKIEEDCMFESWGGGIRELCVRGFMNYTVQEKKQYIASPEFSPIPEEEAKFEIARRYFTNIAPATIHDAMYYTGAKQAEVKNWLRNLPVESFDFGGRTYYYIPNGKTYDGDIVSRISERIGTASEDNNRK